MDAKNWANAKFGKSIRNAEDDLPTFSSFFETESAEEPAKVSAAEPTEENNLLLNQPANFYQGMRCRVLKPNSPHYGLKICWIQSSEANTVVVGLPPSKNMEQPDWEELNLNQVVLEP